MYSQNSLSASLPKQNSLCGIICQSSVLSRFLQKGFNIIQSNCTNGGNNAIIR